MRRPNFFIVGAPRCGTTALWTYLKAHPEIFMSSQKELYYFDSDLHPEGWTQLSLEQYLSNFASADDRGLVGDDTELPTLRARPSRNKGIQSQGANSYHAQESCGRDALIAQLSPSQPRALDRFRIGLGGGFETKGPRTHRLS